MNSHPLWSARSPDLSACDLSIGKFERKKTHKTNPRKQDVPEEAITDVVSAICIQNFQTVFNNRLPLVKHIWEL
jgi:hypothetical protein